QQRPQQQGRIIRQNAPELRHFSIGSHKASNQNRLTPHLPQHLSRGKRHAPVDSAVIALSLKFMSRMLDEIREQPGALERTLAEELLRLPRFERAVAGRRPRLIVLVARGTSDNAAQFGRYLLEITTGIPVSLAAPSISTLYDAPLDYRDSLVIAISQSGESTDTNLVLERARARGAMTIGVTN